MKNDRPVPLLVLGLGNVLCGDDGLGAVAVHLLQRRYQAPDGVSILDGGTLGLSLLPYLEEAHEAILVDAIRGDGPPGSFVRLEGDEVAPAVAGRLSVHQVGVADLLEGARWRERSSATRLSRGRAMRRLPAALAISLTFSACSGPDSDLPRAYRRVAVPEERLRAREAIARGEVLYGRNCVLCHGERGNGQGRRSAGFARAPTRFADPAWRRRTTPRQAFYVIREGRRGTPMPGWSWLGENETWDVVAYVLSLAGERPETTARPPRVAE
jgi:hydrogenase maturation protease